MINPYLRLKRLTTTGIFSQVSWFGFGQVGIQIFSFLGVMITSRYLGPTNVGLYSFVQNYLLAFMTLMAGMEFYFTWRIAKSGEQIKELKEFFGFKLNIALILTFVGVVCAWLTLPKDVATFATIMFFPLPLTACSAFLQYAIVHKNARLIALVQLAEAVFVFITRVGLVVMQAPLIGFIIVNALDVVLVGLILTIFYLRNEEMQKIFWETAYPSLQKTFHFMYSIRMSILASGLWQLTLRIDQLVLATFNNAYLLGIYAAAVKIAEVPNFLAGTLYAALVTHVALFAGKEDDFSKRRIRQVFLLYLGAGIVIALFVMLCAPLAVHVLYGQKFLEAVPVLRAYALSIPGMFVTIHYFGIYGAKEKPAFQSLAFFVGLLLNVALIFILTPQFGLSGAAYATAISYTLVALSFYIHLK